MLRSKLHCMGHCPTLAGQAMQGCQQLQQAHTCTCQVRRVAAQLQALPFQATASRVERCTALEQSSTGLALMSQGTLSLRLTDGCLTQAAGVQAIPEMWCT
jgi:hypothetical protein